MNIVVCVKQVPNPEIPPGKFKIDPEARKAVPPKGVAPVMSPFDERAVEVALRIKEQAGARITVVSMGPRQAAEVVKFAISMGADEGIILTDKAFDDSDSFGTAHVLAKAIQKLGACDLVLCGRQAADWDAGQVGSILAENLGWSLITRARGVKAADGRLLVEHVTSDGYDVFEVTLPAVVTVSQEIGVPRLPTGKGILAAARKQIPVWTAAEIGADAAMIGPGAARTELLSLSIPVHEARCEIIAGENTAEAAVKLALRLREAKIV